MKPIIPIEGNYTNGNQLHEASLKAITARNRKAQPGLKIFMLLASAVHNI